MNCILLIFLAFAQIGDTINDTLTANQRLMNDSIDTSILDDSFTLDSINPLCIFFPNHFLVYLINFFFFLSYIYRS